MVFTVQSFFTFVVCTLFTAAILLLCLSQHTVITVQISVLFNYQLSQYSMCVVFMLYDMRT